MHSESRSLEKLYNKIQSRSSHNSTSQSQEIRIKPSTSSTNSSKARALESVVREVEEREYNMDLIISPKNNENDTSPLTLDRIDTRQSARGRNSARKSKGDIGAIYEVVEGEPIIDDLSMR